MRVAVNILTLYDPTPFDWIWKTHIGSAGNGV